MTHHTHTHHTQQFNAHLAKDEATQKKVSELRGKVEVFATQFPMPGFEDH